MPSNIGRRGTNNTYRSKQRNDGRTNTSNSGNQRRGGPGGDRSRNSNNQSYRNSSSNVMDFGRSSRPIVSPWESGVTPGVQSGLLGSYAQPASLMQIPQMSRLSGFETSNYGSYGGPPSKMRRLERGPMGSYDDQRGRGLLPSPPGAPLLGVAPQSYGSSASEPFVRQRLGSFWNNQFPSGSAYFPSDRSARNVNRRQRPTNNNRSRRPQQKSPTHKGGSSQESRNRNKGSRTTKKDSNRSKSPDSSKDSKEEPKKSSTKVDRSKDKDEDTVGMSEEHDEDEKMEDEETDKQELDEGKKDENQDSEKKKENRRDSDKKKSQDDDYPPNALYCHICDLDSFSCRKGYVRHLQGLTHSKMSELFHAKNAAALELLNISAKLAEMRQRDKVLRRTGKRGMPVMKTTEQILVQKWLKVGSCCGMKFKSPFELEEHKLSLNHLKAKFESQPESKESKEGEEITKEEDKEETEEDRRKDFMKAFDYIEEARKLAEANPLNVDNMEAYDPSKPIGLEYLRQLVFYNCKACQGQAFHNLEGHCQSHKHYTTIVDSLNKKEDAKREKKRVEEEKAREEKREAERKEKARKLEAEKAEEAAKEEEAAELAEEILDFKEEDLSEEVDFNEDVVEEEEAGDEVGVKEEEEEEAGDEEYIEEVGEEFDDNVGIHCADDEPEAIDESSMDAKQNGDDVEMKEDVEDNLINEIAEGIDYDVVDLENQIKDEDDQNEEVEEDPDPSPKRTYPSRRRGRARKAK